MKTSVISYSLSEDPMRLSEWKEKLLSQIQSCVNSGADVILFPELFLMGLAKYTDAKNPLEEITKTADLLEKDILPFIRKEVTTWVTIVLGSGPRVVNDRIFNSAPILHKGEWIFQDKLFLTPWETDFTPGNELFVFDVKGLKTCVVICFDSEQPDLAVKLKSEQVDYILVPSATTNKNGNQRVNRCASSRSVELGAVVITSPLVGDCGVDLVDHNEGRQGMFLPAQESMTDEQEQFSEYSSGKHIFKMYEFDERKILDLKNPSSETKPFLKEMNEGVKISRLR